MASEPEAEPIPQAAAADKPLLVCAPCWICLEDGPDEAGEPLIRECACRGETSAGYHLSCIIEFAKRKSQRFINMGEAPGLMKDLENPYPDLLDHWRVCFNCKQFYDNGVDLKLAEAYYEFTQHLPETWCVRYEAQFLLIEKRVQNESDLDWCEHEIKDLFSTVAENADRMGKHYYDSPQTKKARKQFVEIERERLCKKLAGIESRRGNQERSLALFERAVEACRYLVRCGAAREEDLAMIEEELNFRKAVSGQKVENREATLRQELAQHLSADGGNELMVIMCMNRLVFELTNRDRPDFIEAIKLLEKVLVRTKRLFGPSHNDTLDVKERLEEMKTDYRNYLRKIQHETP